MPPKRKPRQPLAQAAVSVTTRTRRPKGQTPAQPRPTKSRRGKPRGLNLPWFLLGQFSVTSDQGPGPMETLLLHPTEFPDTPYATACSHHTHRVEHMWEFKTEVTTASNTGLRAALVLLPDPRLDPNSLTPPIVWSAVLAGQGAMMTSTGQGNKSAKLTAPPTTHMLSNAAPPQGVTSWVGFAIGSLVIFLLEPPIGITGTSKVNITVLARPVMTLHYPLSGFMAWTQSAVQPTPQGAGWSFTIGPQANPMTLNSHTASASLAGGCYWQLDNTRPSWCSGDLWVYGVYSCDHQGYDWQDNDSQSHNPNYYVIWRESGSTVTQVIGFRDFRDARNQVDGYYTAVPHGAELCIVYSNSTVQYRDRFEGLTSGGTVHMTLVYKHPSAYLIWTIQSTNNRPRALAAPPPRHSANAPDLPESLLSPATRAVQIGRTEQSSQNPAATLVSGLTDLVRGLQGQLQDLTRELQELKASSPQPTPPLRQSLQNPGTPVDGPPSTNPFRNSMPPAGPSNPPALQSLTTTPQMPWPWSRSESSLQASRVCYSAPPTLLSPSNPFLDLADGTMQRPTGCRQLPPTWELPACPGCQDLECDDCFEDADEESVITLPSHIGSVESLVAALSRLGGTDV